MDLDIYFCVWNLCGCILEAELWTDLWIEQFGKYLSLSNNPMVLSLKLLYLCTLMIYKYVTNVKNMQPS